METSKQVILLTDQGIKGLDGLNRFNGSLVTSSITSGDTFDEKLAVVVDKHEIWIYDGGEWEKEVSSDVRINCLKWFNKEELLAGTESARVAWVNDNTLDFIEQFDKVPGRNLWTTPFGTPPDVRSLAISDDGVIYVNIHVGWIVRSMDRGESWTNLQEGLEMDVHQVGVSLSDPATVFTATADGFYVSTNHGTTFDRRDNGLNLLYSRACVCFPEKEVYLLSTSGGPYGDIDAGIYVSADQGIHWKRVKGLPETQLNIDTFQILTVENGSALTVINNDSIYESEDYGAHWSLVRSGFPRIYGILAISAS